jgi:hypothetical protein
MKNQKIKITTIQEMFDVVTPEDIDNFLDDIRAILLGYMTSKIAAQLNSIPLVDGFVWTDDGIVEGITTITNIDNTNDVVEIKIYK